MSVLLNTNLQQIKAVAALLNSAADVIWLHASFKYPADLEITKELRQTADLLLEALKQ